MFGWIAHRSRLLADRERLGRWGERRAEKALRKQGLQTLTRNYSCKTGEIDIVMVDTDSSIVFVEVRTRAGNPLESPESTVTAGKRMRLLRAAKYFLAVHDIGNRPLRFDVVAITLGRSGRAQIEHYRNAFTS